VRTPPNFYIENIYIPEMPYQFMRLVLATSILLYFIVPCYSQNRKPIPITGTYEMGLQVCYNPATGEISGILSVDNSEDKPRVHISCDQYFTGYHHSSDRSNEFSIQSRYPDDTTKETLSLGKLKIGKEEVSIQIDEPGSCGNLNLFDLKYGWDFDLEKRDNFIACRIVKASRAYFYSEPNDSTKLKAYVIKDDAILIKRVKDDWLNVAYVNKNGVVKVGWIKRETIRTGMHL
jgi:hypothetical protein